MLIYIILSIFIGKYFERFHLRLLTKLGPQAEIQLSVETTYALI